VRPERVFLVLLLLLTAACVHRPASDAVCLQPARGLRYCLLPPDALTADGNARLVHVSTREDELHLLAMLETGPEELVLYASSLLGQPLFEIHYTAQGVDVRPATAPVRADWLIALLQFAEAPPGDVNAALRGARLIAGHDSRQLLMNDGESIMSISSAGETTEIHLPAQSLRVVIRQLKGEQ